MNNLKKYIQGICFLNGEELKLIEGAGTLIHLKKGSLIVRERERFDKEVFIENGVVRGYIVDDEGNEKSTAFYLEGEFMSTGTLRTINGVSLANFQVLADSKLIVFNSQKLKDILSQGKILSLLGKKIKEKEVERLGERDKCLLQVRGSDKYQRFLKYYPKIERYISQKYIASYLGITPVALSRIKKEIATVNNC